MIERFTSMTAIPVYVCCSQGLLLATVEYAVNDAWIENKSPPFAHADACR